MSDDRISDELSPFAPDVFEKLDSTLPFPQKTGIDRAAWDKFVGISMPEEPQKIDRQTFDALSPSDKNRSRILRRQYFIKAGPFFPPSYKAILDELQDIALVGLEMSEGIRMGAVITGLPTTGKTTITRAFGKKWHLSRKTVHMLEYGCDDTVRGEGLWDFVPVVYIDLRGTSTWEGLLQSIAIFYRIPDYQALNEAELLELVIEYINECGTSLIIIDDIHYLNFDLKGKENINNNLKHLCQSTAATFIYAGINCDLSGLFIEWNKDKNSTISQTNFRFSRFELPRFTDEYLKLSKNKNSKNSKKSESKQVETESKYDELERLLITFEKYNVLLDFQKGDILRLKDYLLKRSYGLLGSVVHLLRMGASLALKDQVEKLSPELLDRVKLSNGVETARRIDEEAKKRK